MINTHQLEQPNRLPLFFLQTEFHSPSTPTNVQHHVNPRLGRTQIQPENQIEKNEILKQKNIVNYFWMESRECVELFRVFPRHSTMVELS